jgi:hypothetical protein
MVFGSAWVAMARMVDRVTSIGWRLITLSPCFVRNTCATLLAYKYIVFPELTCQSPNSLFRSRLALPNIGKFHHPFPRSVESFHSSSVYRYFSLFLKNHSIICSTFQTSFFPSKSSMPTHLCLDISLSLSPLFFLPSPFRRTTLLFLP